MSKDYSLLFVVVVIYKSGRPHKRFLLLFNWKSERGLCLNAKLALNVVQVYLLTARFSHSMY